ncbi:hypothetical protein [Frankia sp. AgB32]|uniref:hypothetical protein n=1 Tax=Frankia sp. AgB32 TaxID=631119 RepID=UPI00200E2FAD|nr:hypothetical protein [Frankia sp. AgB32]MCK9896596.1 hypothetical protein [Frankia sp. AgB32]
MVVTVAGALVAALGGWMLWLPARPVWWAPLAVVLGSAIGGVLLAWLVVLPARPDEPAPEPAHRRPTEPEGRHAGRRALDAGPRTVRDPDVERPTQVILPVERPPGAPAAGRWWNQGAPPPAVGRGESAAPDRPATHDPIQVPEAPRVVQCPRCGAFRVDVGHTSAGYAFRCRVDAHEWTWRPGTAWPPTVVASRRRRAP